MSNAERPINSQGPALPATPEPHDVAPPAPPVPAAFTDAELEALEAFAAEEERPAVTLPEASAPSHPPVLPYLLTMGAENSRSQSAPPIIEPHPAEEPTDPIGAAERGAVDARQAASAAAAATADLQRSTAPADTSLGDILDRDGGMDPQAAIEIIHRLCHHLREHHPRGSVLLDPHNIEVSGTGQVRLLTSQASSDPLVRQIGHLLRTMLMGRTVAAELRLLMARATFELPIFESVEELEQALASANQRDNDSPGAIQARKALAGQAAPPQVSAAAGVAGHANEREPLSLPNPALKPIRPAKTPWRSSSVRLPGMRRWLALHGARVAGGAFAVGALAGLLWNPPAFLLTHPRRSPSTPIVAAGQARLELAKPDTNEGRHERASNSSGAGRGELPAVGAARQGRRGGTTLPMDRPPTMSSSPGPTIAVSPVATDHSVTLSEKRATALAAKGSAIEATMVFDALLLGNPLYEPRPTDLTPESLAAFKASQRALLPVLAQRSYDRARTALAAGDPERAATNAREGAAILERTAADSGLRHMLQQVGEEAAAAISTADNLVYSATDTGVIPPRALSRQFPATTPNGVPAHRVGTLEMVIGRDGSVEFVKLHTPLNRYHERMIVSAAKAWQYRPATKAGRPVKYRLTVTINLPENGTY